VLIFRVAIVPAVVRDNAVDGRFGKFSGVQGFVGSANNICPDDSVI
jgi:hypothetical protein